jgi:hypothetical protein
MIVSQKYTLVEKENSNKFPYVQTILEAKLRFKNEVVFPERKEVINKIYGKVYGENQEPGLLSEYPLDDYLNKTEKIIHNQLNGKYWDSDWAKERTIKIKKSKFKLGLDIKVSSNKKLKAGELLNLDDLSYFILTGKYPNN